MNKPFAIYVKIIIGAVLIATIGTNYAMEEGKQQEVFPFLSFPDDIICYIALPKTNKYNDLKPQLTFIYNLMQVNKRLCGLFVEKFQQYKKMLISANSYDEYCYTPLGNAVKDNDIKTVEFLINHGANVNNGASRGVFLLRYALFQNYKNGKKNKEIIRLLLENEVIINDDDVLNAVLEQTKEFFDIAEWFFQYGFDINKRYDGDAFDINTRRNLSGTVLHIAVKGGFDKSVEFLLNHGADKTLKDDNDHTAYDVTDNPTIIALLQDDNVPQRPSKKAKCIEKQKKVNI